MERFDIHISAVIATSLLAMLSLSACSQKPDDIHYGSEKCSHCRMVIADGRFAAQAVTGTGKSIKFDAVECMAAYAGDHKSELTDARFWVNDFNKEHSWIEISEAVIIKSNVIKSPMGASLLAVGSDETATEHLEKYPGKRVEWQRLVK